MAATHFKCYKNFWTSAHEKNKTENKPKEKNQKKKRKSSTTAAAAHKLM